jgi:hypothetical protein
MTVRLSPPDLAEAKRIRTWWRLNRQAAPHLFEQELKAVLARLRTTPDLGIAVSQVALKCPSAECQDPVLWRRETPTSFLAARPPDGGRGHPVPTISAAPAIPGTAGRGYLQRQGELAAVTGQKQAGGTRASRVTHAE